MIFICIKQHLSNSWRSIHYKVKLKLNLKKGAVFKNKPVYQKKDFKDIAKGATLNHFFKNFNYMYIDLLIRKGVIVKVTQMYALPF